MTENQYLKSTTTVDEFHKTLEPIQKRGEEIMDKTIEEMISLYEVYENTEWYAHESPPKMVCELLDRIPSIAAKCIEQAEELANIKAIWKRNYGFLHYDDMRLGFESEMQRIFPDIEENNSNDMPLDYDALIFRNKEQGEEIQQLRAENERLRGGWLDIASAPRDGSNIVLALISVDDQGNNIVDTVCVDRWYQDRIMGDWEEWRGFMETPPTHWMPLPTTPTNDKQG